MQAGHSMKDIDGMDFIFYLDILIFDAKEKQLETIEEYDKSGF